MDQLFHLIMTPTRTQNYTTNVCFVEFLWIRRKSYVNKSWERQRLKECIPILSAFLLSILKLKLKLYHFHFISFHCISLIASSVTVTPLNFNVSFFSLKSDQKSKFVLQFFFGFGFFHVFHTFFRKNDYEVKFNIFSLIKIPRFQHHFSQKIVFEI